MAQRGKEQAADGTVTIHLPCQFEYLRIARQSIIDVCARAGLSEYKTAQLEMAVDEACANIIEHSYGKDPNNPEESNTPGMQINLSAESDKVQVEVIDYGVGYEYEHRQEIHPEEYVKENRARGLGLYIIRNFVDEIDYVRDQSEGNRLRLIKYL
jgi:serine/threonine-protein kinase RsbW